MRQSLLSAASASLLAVLLAAGPALAHHSLADFDPHDPVTVRGTVTSIRFRNPHSVIFLDTRDASGKPVKWMFEVYDVANLFHNGVKRGVIKAGDEVTIKAFRARDGSKHEGAAHEVILASGRSLVVGPGTIPPER